MKTKILYFLLIINLFNISCQRENHSLLLNEKYKGRLGFLADSIVENSDDYYYTRISMCNGIASGAYSGLLKVKDSVFYYKSDNEVLVTEFFPVFDLTKTEYDVKIPYVKKSIEQMQEEIHIRRIQILYTEDKQKVYVFQIKGLFCEKESKMDVVYFVTYQEGVIGSYLLVLLENGKKLIGAKGGNIFEDQIDYSGYTGFQIL